MVELLCCCTAVTVAVRDSVRLTKIQRPTILGFAAKALVEGARMKTFAPDSKMFTFGGVFYPTGHVFVMFPSADDALDAAKKLINAGYDGGSLCLLTPKDIHDKVAATALHEEG